MVKIVFIVVNLKKRASEPSVSKSVLRGKEWKSCKLNEHTILNVFSIGMYSNVCDVRIVFIHSLSLSLFHPLKLFSFIERSTRFLHFTVLFEKPVNYFPFRMYFLSTVSVSIVFVWNAFCSCCFQLFQLEAAYLLAHKIVFLKKCSCFLDEK